MPYINTTTNQHPISEQDIRNLNPNTSFSTPFVAPEPYAWVFPSPQPTVTNLQMVREIAPVLTSKGHYEQRFEVVDKFQGADKAEQEVAYLEQLRKDAIPVSVSIRQACRALEQVGKLDELEAAISQAPRWIQIDWAKCTEVRRDWPAIPLMQPALGMTDLEIDNLFVLAATL